MRMVRCTGLVVSLARGAFLLAVVVLGASCRFDSGALLSDAGGPGSEDSGADRAVELDAPTDSASPHDGEGPESAAGTDATTDVPTDAATDAAPDHGASAENCLNGTDDDGDGLIDCQDPACQAAYACVDAPPAGWQGYYYLRQTAYADATPPPACGDGSAPTRLDEGPINSSAVCAACTCGPTQGAACGPPVINCWLGHDKCNGGGQYDATSELARSGCVASAATGGTTSCEVVAGPSVTSDGTCVPSTMSITRPDPWTTHDDVCPVVTAGGGCGAQVCAPRPQYPYATLCVRHAGDVDCPTGWATLRHVVYATTADGRDCTPCACTPSPASCIGGSYQVDGCTATCNGHCPGVSNPAPIAPGSGCRDLSAYVGSTVWSSQYTAPSLAAGSCTATGGAPIGSVSRTNAATYCCRP
jgi:hypothetical protein